MSEHLTYASALELLNRFAGDAAWVRHCHAVARVAEAAGTLISRKDQIDGEFLRAGALLHDIGRSRTHDPIGHGVEGYRLLMEQGHEREAYICASHILCGLSRDEALAHGLPDRDFLPRSSEEKLVPLIDSLVEFDRPTTLDKRVSSIMRRYQGHAWFLKRMELAHGRARLWMEELEERHGFSLENLARDVLQ